MRTRYYTESEAVHLIFLHEATLEYIKPALKSLGITHWKDQDDAVRKILPRIKRDRQCWREIRDHYFERRRS